MKNAYFISPHFDDAVFSAGGLMLKLAKQGYKVTVINVFTRAEKTQLTLSARAFLRQIGERDASLLYKTRIKEDAKAIKAAGAEVINLGEVEALWRKKTHPSIIERRIGAIIPEFLNVYPTYKFHIIKGVISKNDELLQKAITAKLGKIINDKALIFCPLGIGNHVDHIITREACKMLELPLIYWADIPYKNTFCEDKVYIRNNNLKRRKLSDLNILKRKKDIAKLYVSQYKPVFGELVLEKVEEEYFLNSSYDSGLFEYEK